MKRYFLDTNILLDFLGDRRPFSKYALLIMNNGRLGEWELWASDNSITTCFYILEQKIGAPAAKEKIGLLLQYLSIQPVGKAELQLALASKFKDFEDGVQHVCALNIPGLDAIVTRNQKDFKESQVAVLGPEELFEA